MGRGSVTGRGWRIVAGPATGIALAACLFLASALAVGGQARAAPTDLAQLEQRARTIETQLEQRYAAMERLAEAADAAAERQKDLKQQLADLSGRRASSEAQLAQAQQQLDSHVRAAYMAGPGFFVSELLGAADPTDALRRLPLQESVLESDARVLDQVRDQKAHLDLLNNRLGSALAEQRKITDAYAGQQRQIQALTDQLGGMLKGMDPSVLAAIAADQQQGEAARRAAWAAYMAAVKASGGGQPWLQASPLAKRAVQFALKHMGDPYQWGAQGPSRFDCSGLTSAAYAAAGWPIPRTSREQFGAGLHVAVSDLLPGDLVFYADNPSEPWTIHHVGMYVGGGLMVHAPHTGAVVSLASIWRTEYAGAVRIIPGVLSPGVPGPPPTSGVTTTTRPPVMTTAPPTTTKPPTTTPPTTAPPTTVPPTTVPPTTAPPPTTEPATTTPPPTT